MAPKEIWCNESQERYVLAIAPESLASSKRCASASVARLPVIGVATEERQSAAGRMTGRDDAPVDMPMNVLLGKPPKMHRDVKTVRAQRSQPLDLTGVDLQKAVIDVLAHPTVASKRFLITIGDRTVGG